MADHRDSWRKPAPRPVWFVWDGTAIVIYSMNEAARLRYIERNPQVTVHFNSVGGGDILVISGTGRSPWRMPRRHRRSRACLISTGP